MKASIQSLDKTVHKNLFSSGFFLAPCCWPVFTCWAIWMQKSWHLLGGTVQAAYASQVTCSQTCNLQIINVVLISHINSCHFVGMVFTPSSRSLGPVPATSASETARVITLLQSESGVSEERKVAGCFTHAHAATRTRTHTHRRTDTHTHLYHTYMVTVSFLINSTPPYGHPHTKLYMCVYFYL